MTLDNFKTLIRAYVPGAGVKVSDTVLELMINKGVEDVNIRAAALSGDKKFNVVAEQRNYMLSSEIADFTAFDKGGLWWNAGTAASPDWRKLDPTSREGLNANFPQWMNQDSDNPIRYVHEKNNLQIDPMPNTTLTEGFWAFYVKKPTAMTAGGHYPFSGTTTEIVNLVVLDDAIIDYVRWKLNPMLGKDEKGVLIERDYTKSLAERIRLLDRRLDMSAHTNLRMKIPAIG